ncbi:MAG: hypothetical protein MR598_03795 [Erysipelotrichaceae bacterium]|nr:hypothetical protein [Erysipelotrichaceae bacterium]
MKKTLVVLLIIFIIIILLFIYCSCILATRTDNIHYQEKDLTESNLEQKDKNK